MLGSDAIKTFPLWNNPKRILELTKIILAERKYEVSPTLLKELSQISDISGKIIFLKSKMLDISSSDIRRKISAGESIQGLVPNQVQEFISKLKIYK
jgi:nicotinate-nucleotide adenylyltransferase|tara:strand:- start:280 stop:570 length:291 start_codon:yes stop_codon:yes gene_type:complete